MYLVIFTLLLVSWFLLLGFFLFHGMLLLDFNVVFDFLLFHLHPDFLDWLFAAKKLRKNQLVVPLKDCCTKKC